MKQKLINESKKGSAEVIDRIILREKAKLLANNK